MDNAVEILYGLIALGGMYLLLGVLIYFLPTVIAVARSHSSGGVIFILNLLLGWTFIVWIIVAIWSIFGSSHKREEQNINIHNHHHSNNHHELQASKQSKSAFLDNLSPELRQQLESELSVTNAEPEDELDEETKAMLDTLSPELREKALNEYRENKMLQKADAVRNSEINEKILKQVEQQNETITDVVGAVVLTILLIIVIYYFAS